MGLLKRLKSFLNRADAYGQLTHANKGRLFMGNERIDRAGKAMYSQLNDEDEDRVDTDGELLPDAELGRDTSPEALAKRDAAIERERRRREAGQ
jgi:hypothetical protein